MLEAVTWGALGFGSLAIATAALLAVRRLVVSASERRRFVAEAGLRPLALALVAGDTGRLQNLTPRDARALARVVGRYASVVSGTAAERITLFFEQRGLVDGELRALRSRRAWRRAAAAFELGNMRATRAGPALIDALRDRDRDVRLIAARSLGRIGAVAAVEPIVHAYAARGIPRLAAGQALLSIGSASLPALCRLLDDPDPIARAFAIELIGLVGDGSHADSLHAYLRDSSAEVRAKAARALGRLGADEAALALRAALEDRVGYVRAVAAGALGSLGDERAVPALLEIARHGEFAAAHAAAAAATRLAPRTVMAAAAREDATPHLVEAATLAAVRR